jgi:hypothetical protein
LLLFSQANYFMIENVASSSTRHSKWLPLKNGAL